MCPMVSLGRRYSAATARGRFSNYGNIDSEDRLDFTIIGPALNEVSHILATSRSVEQNLLLSSLRSAPTCAAIWSSIGRDALRDIGGA